MEYSRNEHSITYKCGCHFNKGVEWDWQDALVNGVQYLLGSAGSFTYVCPECDSVVMRQQLSYQWCVYCCREGKEVEMSPLTREIQDKRESDARQE